MQNANLLPLVLALAVVFPATASGQARFRRGDANASGAHELGDPIVVLNFLFLDGPAPSCLDAGDADDSGNLEITDAVGLLTDQVDFATTGHDVSTSCETLGCGLQVERNHTVPIAPDNRRWSGTPYGLYPPDQFGLYHTHGNVWEWCRDGYDSGFYRRPEARGPDPVSTGDPGYRAVRGGSWAHGVRRCRSADRGWDQPANRRHIFGFRPAKVIAE